MCVPTWHKLLLNSIAPFNLVVICTQDRINVGFAIRNCNTLLNLCQWNCKKIISVVGTKDIFSQKSGLLSTGSLDKKRLCSFEKSVWTLMLEFNCAIALLEEVHVAEQWHGTSLKCMFTACVSFLENFKLVEFRTNKTKE